MQKNIAIASDHAGLELKEQIKSLLTASGYAAKDMGTHNTDSVDYPDFAHAMAKQVGEHIVEYGILICGSGIGMSIAANRHAGVRAALCMTAEMAGLAREHNNANILVLGARITPKDEAWQCVERFLSTPFAGGRHETRVEKLG